jgi:metal-responsive CopG/Arc/MetJ family transcriptional regulator
VQTNKITCQRISLSLSADLLNKIEEGAKANYCTRSEYIRAAVTQRLNCQLTAVQLPKSTASPIVAPQSEDEFIEALFKHYADQ